MLNNTGNAFKRGHTISSATRTPPHINSIGIKETQLGGPRRMSSKKVTNMNADSNGKAAARTQSIQLKGSDIGVLLKQLTGGEDPH